VGGLQRHFPAALSGQQEDQFAGGGRRGVNKARPRRQHTGTGVVIDASHWHAPFAHRFGQVAQAPKVGDSQLSSTKRISCTKGSMPNTFNEPR